MTIKTKLFAGFSFVLVLLAGIGTLGGFGLLGSAKRAETINGFIEDVVAAGETRAVVTALSQSGLKAVLEPIPERVSGFREAGEEMDRSFEGLNEVIGNPERRAKLAEYRATADEYEAALGGVIDRMVRWRATIVETLHPLNIDIRSRVAQFAEQSAGNLPPEQDKIIQTATRSYFNGLVSVKYFFLMTDPKDADDAVRLIGEAREGFASVAGSIENNELNSWLTSIVADLDRTSTVFGELRTIQSEAWASLQSGEIKSLESTLAGDATSFAAELAQVSNTEAGTAVAAARSLTLTVIVASAVGIAAGVFAAFWIGRAVSGRIGSMLRETRSITESGTTDLDVRLSASGNDELSEFAQTINSVLDSMAGAIGELTQVTDRVATSASQVNGAATEIASGAGSQQQQTEQVAAAIEEMSASAVEVAQQGDNAATSVRESGENARQGGEVVRETIEEIQAIASEVGHSRDSINELGAKGEQIGEIIGVINEIAEQTNLLALNAAIEAARAGEHGRGFAVVADEVRKLAERTTTATDEVSRSIREIQQGTEAAVQQIESSASRVGRGVELAQSAGQALESIVASADSLTGTVQSIAAAAQEQSSASDEVTRNIASIREVSSTTARSANEVSSSASELDNETSKLKTLVQRFKVSS
ncbi:MAG: methyl-accepting chemotaxis protein [Planctomycetota bacterium]